MKKLFLLKESLLLESESGDVHPKETDYTVVQPVKEEEQNKGGNLDDSYKIPQGVFLELLQTNKKDALSLFKQGLVDIKDM